jgi:hypothetical protein
MYNPQMAPFQPQNIDRTTAMLVALKQKGQLAQYMQQYKSDPYMISLASFVNATAEAAQPLTAPQQPKVVDQELAKMEPQQPQMPQGQAQPMPEDVGIGALPAGDMNFAEGGIVAFAGEGPSLVQDMSPDAINERYRQAQLQKLKDMFGITGVSRGSQSGFTPEEKLAGVAAPVMGPAVSAAYPDETRRGAAANLLPAAPGGKPPPVAGAGAGPGAGAPRAAAAAAPAGLSYLDQLKKAQTAMGPAVNPEQAAMEKLVGERNLGATEAKKELEADIASRADQFKGRDERSGKRQAELDKSKDTNMGTALLEAGLKMMQARGPGLAGIAEGAGVGLKQYQSGIKDLRMAQEKLDDARDRTDELKQNQSTMDKREVRAANKDIRDASLAGQQYQLDARMKIYGENRADARAGIASDIARSESALDRQSRIQVAGMPSGVERMAAQLGGKDGLAAGLKKYSELMGAESKGLASLLAAYAKDPVALKTLEATDPALAAQVKQAMQGMLLQPQSKPSGAVRD